MAPRDLHELLTGLQDECRQRIKDLRRDQAQESESGPADEIDSANATEEIETHAGLIAREEDKLKYLDEALARLDAGKYGNCVGCHRPIPLERLIALPFASYCIECQEKRNRARHDWGEGVMIQPYDHQWTVPEEMQEPADRESRTTAPEEDLTVHYREPVGREDTESQRKRSASPEKRARRRKN